MQIAQKNFYKKFLGRAGELKAADFLEKKGYKILTVNYKTHVGEIDIIAKDKVRSKMLGFKLLALSTLALTVGAIFANMMMSDSAKEYYMNPMGQQEILLTLLVGFITFLCMMIVEKL